MVRVHVAPSATVKLEEYGRQAISPGGGGRDPVAISSLVPSVQLRLQPISTGNDPQDKVTSEEILVASRTTKDTVSLAPVSIPKLCPKPGAAHSPPFQPSGYESVMVRVHVAPSATVKLEEYGGQSSPSSELDGRDPVAISSSVPSVQLRLQPISAGNDPQDKVTSEEILRQWIYMPFSVSVPSPFPVE